MTDYVVCDVFTDTAFGGNPLAVIPDAAALPENLLQKIAREFNFSETTFVFPPKNPNHTARIRIFTPTMEIPFAGHPVIGTAVVLAGMGRGPAMMLELGVGPISCHATETSAKFTTSAPLQRIAEPDSALVAAALGLSPDDIRTDTHRPLQASLGLPFVLVELKDRSRLAAATPVLEVIRRGVTQHPKGHDFSIFAYVRDGESIAARMFAPLDNIPEDPATGSACATLAALLTDILNMPLSLIIRQGEDMGRPSLINATTTLQPPVAVTISGTAIMMMEGRLVC